APPIRRRGRLRTGAGLPPGPRPPGLLRVRGGHRVVWGIGGDIIPRVGVLPAGQRRRDARVDRDQLVDPGERQRPGYGGAGRRPPPAPTPPRPPPPPPPP